MYQIMKLFKCSHCDILHTNVWNKIPALSLIPMHNLVHKCTLPSLTYDGDDKIQHVNASSKQVVINQDHTKTYRMMMVIILVISPPTFYISKYLFVKFLFKKMFTLLISFFISNKTNWRYINVYIYIYIYDWFPLHGQL